MKGLLFATVIALTATEVRAETFTYACEMLSI
jgi:hypothetical protein